MLVGVSVFVRNEFNISAFHRLQCDFGKVSHLEEPLCGELRLDYGIGPLGISDRRDILLDLLETSCLLKHLLDLLSGHETVLSDENLRLFVQFAVIVNDICHRKIVAESDFIVIDVMSRSNLEAAGTESDFNIGILNDRNLLVDQRDENLLAFKPMIAFVVRIDADCSICHDCLRACCRDDDIFVRAVSVAI